MTINEEVRLLCTNAKEASLKLALATTEKKNSVLLRIAEKLKESKEELIAANEKDLAAADANGVPKTMLDRLKINSERIDAICASLSDVASLEDPVGKSESWSRPSGLDISRVRVPIGVIAIIYEARPNVTVDSAALCLKTGNAVVLRGGKEAINTNTAIVEVIKGALDECGLDPHCVELVASTDRESSVALMTMRGLVDVLIPRGGKGLIKSVVENATVPVIETGAGNCHLYVDESADMDMALKIAINAKCSRPSVCNAIETILVHASVAAKFLPAFALEAKKYDLQIRGCAKTCVLVADAIEATDKDFATEYNDFIVAVRVVDSISNKIESIYLEQKFPILFFDIEIVSGTLSYHFYDYYSNLVEIKSFNFDIDNEVICLLEKEGWEKDISGHLILFVY